MKYRPEIDGLRSVAVVPVILFHAGLGLFSGGFVGVDIFFVISGYLITTIILERLNGPGFSLLDFYARRARRILPALLLIMAVTTPFAWAWMLPSEFKDYAQSLAAVSLFSSNFLFWLESGYFAAAAEAKPMLHTWSLAVEEQYYLFFPLLLMLFWRRTARGTVILLCTILVLSLVTSEILWRQAPEANFYLLPSRAWELMVGSLCAVSVLRFGEKPNSALAWLGLGLLVVSIFMFDKQTPFPSLWAIFPVAGTALILVCSGGTTVARLLSTRVMVGIGLISYSAYLWLQPLLALARIRDPMTPPVWFMVVLGLMSLPLAWLSWRFVEQPVRHMPGAAWKVVTGAAVGSMAVFVAGAFLSTSSLHGDYFRSRLSPQNLELLARITRFTEMSHEPISEPDSCRFAAVDYDTAMQSRFEACAGQHGKALVIFGDSHSGDVYNGLLANMDYPFILHFGQGDCRPHILGADCSGTPLPRFLEEQSDRIALAVYAQAGFWLFLDKDGLPRDRHHFDYGGEIDAHINPAAVDRAFSVLTRFAGQVPLLWLGPRLEPHIPLDTLLGVECTQGPESLHLPAEQVEAFQELDSYLAAEAEAAGISYLSEQSLISLDLGQDFYDCERLFWSDTDHWSPEGEKRFGARIAREIETALQVRLAANP